MSQQAIEGKDPKVLWVGPGEVHIDGQHVIRVCRKIKTKNGKQKGFFVKTKKKEQKEAKDFKKQKTIKPSK